MNAMNTSDTKRRDSELSVHFENMYGTHCIDNIETETRRKPRIIEEHAKSSRPDSEHFDSNRKIAIDRYLLNVEKQIRENQTEVLSVCCLRTITVAALVVAASIIAVITFSYCCTDELAVFETQYRESSVKLQEAIDTAISNKLHAAGTLAALYTSRYGYQGVFPKATMPAIDFNEQASGLLGFANGISISFNPIINDSNRAEFEAHATESAELLGSEELRTRQCGDNTGSTCRIISDGIFRKSIDPTTGEVINIYDTGVSPESNHPNTMVPIWQIFPLSGTANWSDVLFNLHSETNRQRALDDLLDHKVPTLTALLHLVEHESMDPSSVLFYPVFDAFPSPEDQVFGRNVAGSISIVFTWKEMLEKVLPNYIQGMHVVLESSVSEDIPLQIWTYKISGEKVTLLGEGDLHEASFDTYKKDLLITLNEEQDLDLGTGNGLITYRIGIYPSTEMRQTYLSGRPMVMTIIIVSIFSFTSFFFILYDYLSRRRQNAIFHMAFKSGKIVDSLFPENVRERLFTNAEHIEGQLEPERESLVPVNRKQLSKRTTFVSYLRRHNSSCQPSDNIASLATPPIADFFEETSIMFCDISNFTEWSSQRTPQEVFQLLETLFIEFDKIAKKMGVFKLSTIGDCYIAVVGIPHHRSDHASVLCLFAEKCRAKTWEVLDELDHTLEGLDSLGMRFGINSGPVTAGVLRGEKSRFELFGDSINTASRMESLGIQGKIQLSETTAECLIQEGKSDWIIPREQSIQVKGKGEMQTYWLEIRSSNKGFSEFDFAINPRRESDLSTDVLPDP